MMHMTPFIPLYTFYAYMYYSSAYIYCQFLHIAYNYRVKDHPRPVMSVEHTFQEPFQVIECHIYCIRKLCRDGAHCVWGEPTGGSSRLLSWSNNNNSNIEAESCGWISSDDCIVDPFFWHCKKGSSSAQRAVFVVSKVGSSLKPEDHNPKPH